MKAIILTYAPVDEADKELLRTTKIFKLAINQHGEQYNPDVRICTDWNLYYLLKNFPEDVISVRQRLQCPSPRVKYSNIEFRGATILAGVDWLISKGYNEILIIGDNTVNTETFQDIVNRGMFVSICKPHIHIYQYKAGNFLLPVMFIKDFIGEGDG